jgi:hypothetical protein
MGFLSGSGASRTTIAAQATRERPPAAAIAPRAQVAG